MPSNTKKDKTKEIRIGNQSVKFTYLGSGSFNDAYRTTLEKDVRVGSATFKKGAVLVYKEKRSDVESVTRELDNQRQRIEGYVTQIHATSTMLQDAEQSFQNSPTEIEIEKIKKELQTLEKHHRAATKAWDKKSSENDLDEPDRFVRLWNELNAAQSLNALKAGEGVIVPFIQGIEPIEEEIADFLVDVYVKTGRILLDGFVVSNFIKTADGRIVCIDMGRALLLQRDEEAQKESKTSLQFAENYLEQYLISNIKYNGINTNVIQALSFLHAHFPDMDKETILRLKNDFWLVDALKRECERWLNKQYIDRDRIYQLFSLSNPETKIENDKTNIHSLEDAFTNLFSKATDQEKNAVRVMCSRAENGPVLADFDKIIRDPKIEDVEKIILWNLTLKKTDGDIHGALEFYRTRITEKNIFTEDKNSKDDEIEKFKELLFSLGVSSDTTKDIIDRQKHTFGFFNIPGKIFTIELLKDTVKLLAIVLNENDMFACARDHGTSSFMLETLYNAATEKPLNNNHIDHLKSILSGNPNTPTGMLEKFSNTKDYSTRINILMNPNVSKQAVNNILSNINDNDIDTIARGHDLLKIALLSNPFVPDDKLQTLLIKSPLSFAEMGALLRNSAASTAVIDGSFRGPERIVYPEILKMLAQHPNTSNDVLIKVAHIAQESYLENQWILERIAKRPNTSADLLIQLTVNANKSLMAAIQSVDITKYAADEQARITEALAVADARKSAIDLITTYLDKNAKRTEKEYAPTFFTRVMPGQKKEMSSINAANDLLTELKNPKATQFSLLDHFNWLLGVTNVSDDFKN